MKINDQKLLDYLHGKSFDRVIFEEIKALAEPTATDPEIEKLSEIVRSGKAREHYKINDIVTIAGHELEIIGFNHDADGKYLRSTPYPKGFAPTMRRYILDHLKSAKTPRLIFVGSMCDLFGEWVSDEWLDTIFAACHTAPQHVYIFLTKNPTRYVDLAQKGLLPGRDNFWYGTSTPTDETPYFWAEGFNTFVSIEPLLAPFENCQNDDPLPVNWVIIGAMTGPGARKNQPRREWLENIEANCRANNTPVFMKNSLAGIWGEPLPQEWPEAMLKHIGRGTEAGL